MVVTVSVLVSMTDTVLIERPPAGIGDIDTRAVSDRHDLERLRHVRNRLDDGVVGGVDHRDGVAARVGDVEAVACDGHPGRIAAHRDGRGVTVRGGVDGVGEIATATGAVVS